MNDLGKALSKERRKQGHSLEYVSEKIKVPEATLLAIERGQKKSLPAKPFVRGFVQSYAKFLGMDLNKCFELFEIDFSGLDVVIDPKSVRPPLDDVPPPPKESVLWFQAPKPFFLLFGFAVVIVLCIFIYMTLQKIQSYEKEVVKSNDIDISIAGTERVEQTSLGTSEETTSKESVDSHNLKPEKIPAVNPEDTKKSDSTQLKGLVATHEDVPLPNSATPTKLEERAFPKVSMEEDKFQKPKKIKQGEASNSAKEVVALKGLALEKATGDRKNADLPVISSSSNLETKPSPTNPAKDAENLSVNPQGNLGKEVSDVSDIKGSPIGSSENSNKNVEVGEQSQLSVEAFETVELDIVWSTGAPQKFLLKPQEVKHIVFTKKVKIRLSDGGVVKLSLNSKTLGVPGTIRQPIELNFP